MNMIQAIQQSGRARVFALLALLFVFGLQSLEVTHNHADQDSAVECLACQSSSTGAVSVAPVSTIGEWRVAAPLVDEPAAPLAAVFTHYDSRGPPHIS